MGAIDVISSTLIEIYALMQNSLPPLVGQFISLFLIALLIFVYALFIWKLYRSVARKNLIDLNLNQYNHYSHPGLTKLVAGFLYFIEYIIILPFMIFFWFVIFTLFLIMLTEGLATSAILLISATIIAATRMTAYYNEDLSKDIAKLLPFTLLALTITKPGFFNIETILGHLTEITPLIGQAFIYLLFIIVLEIILRIFDLVFGVLGISEDESSEETEKKN